MLRQKREHSHNSTTAIPVLFEQLVTVITTMIMSLPHNFYKSHSCGLSKGFPLIFLIGWIEGKPYITQLRYTASLSLSNSDEVLSLHHHYGLPTSSVRH